MHNHDDYKVTNNGKYPGGQLTYIQTDAPDAKDEETDDLDEMENDSCEEPCEEPNEDT
jgi:hypothetical protein